MNIFTALLEKLGKKKLIALAAALALVIAAGITVPIVVTNSRCEHTYDNACDVTCNECGEERTVTHDFADADCLNPKTCTVCGKTEGSALGHEWTTPDVDLCEVQSTCSRCGATDGENKEHTPENDDNDCSTALNCGVCGKEILAAGEHSPEKDDGNCTTEQKCTVCGQVAVAAKDAHNDTDHDYLCDNAGCQVTVGNPPKDESDGIDLPIDTN